MNCDYCGHVINKKLDYHRKMWKKNRFDLNKATYKRVLVHNWCIELVNSLDYPKYYDKTPEVVKEEKRQEKIESKKQEWLQKHQNDGKY